MDWIDFIIFTILFVAAILGLVSGPILQVLRIICILISFFTAFFFDSTLSNILYGIFTPATANVLSYFTIFGVAFIITYIFTDIVKRLIGEWNMGVGLTLFGGLLGIVKGLIFCGVIILGILLFCSKSTRDIVNTSNIAAQIGRGMQNMVLMVPEGVSNKIKGKSEESKKKITPKKDAQPNNDEEFKQTQ